jgi:hypothetical protein
MVCVAKLRPNRLSESKRVKMRQTAVYRDLFAKIDAVRDKVVKQVIAEENRLCVSNLHPAFEFFSQAGRTASH